MKKNELINLVKESIQTATEQAYGSATLTSQGQQGSRFTKTGRPPGVWEQEEQDPYNLILNAEEMYGIAAKEEFGKIHLYPGYTPEDKQLVSYRTNKMYIVVKEDLLTVQFISIQGIVSSEFYKILSNFGFITSEEGSQFSGVTFYRTTNDSGIKMNSEEMAQLIDMMEEARSREADAQSAHYTRTPGTGGTGIDEDLEEQTPPPPIDQPSSGQPDQATAQGTGQAAKKGPKAPKPKKHKYDPDDLQRKQAELLEMQHENMEVDIYNAKQQVRYISKTKANADPKQQGQISKQIAGQKKQIKQLNKSLKQLKKQISDMKKKKPSAGAQKTEGFIKSTAKSLLNQYEKERGNSNLREHMKSHKKIVRRQKLMEGAMTKFFEYFDQGKTNEEIVQLYAQRGVSVPEQFASKARSQYESMKKLKLELETSEQNFKDVSKMMVNNASEEFDGLGSEKQLASGLTK